jgi:DNA ligase 1
VKCVFQDQPQLQSFIIDSEIVAIDPTNGDLKSFQELSNRARKDVEMSDVKVSVCVFTFDLMYLDGEVCPSSCVPTMSRDNYLRRSYLRGHFENGALCSDLASRLSYQVTREQVA